MKINKFYMVTVYNITDEVSTSYVLSVKDLKYIDEIVKEKYTDKIYIIEACIFIGAGEDFYNILSQELKDSFLKFTSEKEAVANNANSFQTIDFIMGEFSKFEGYKSLPRTMEFKFD